jgi:hypothetical protein
LPPSVGMPLGSQVTDIYVASLRAEGVAPNIAIR